ncbi:MAG: hypothetical protein M3R13_10200 [Armatimonadota bacterium]|nr:hypothetical protein [Armatimonadota bacterium]
MKAARSGAMVFSFLSLVGGYFLHQYFWFSGAEGAKGWNDAVLPLTIILGWILLAAAAAMSFSKSDEADL